MELNYKQKKKKCLLSVTGRGILSQTLRMLLARTNKMRRLLNRGPPLNVERREQESQYEMAGKSSLSGEQIRSPHADLRLARMRESTAGTQEQRKSERRVSQSSLKTLEKCVCDTVA